MSWHFLIVTMVVCYSKAQGAETQHYTDTITDLDSRPDLSEKLKSEEEDRELDNVNDYMQEKEVDPSVYGFKFDYHRDCKILYTRAGWVDDET